MIIKEKGVKIYNPIVIILETKEEACLIRRLCGKFSTQNIKNLLHDTDAKDARDVHEMTAKIYDTLVGLGF
jgi:hypothetical protein